MKILPLTQVINKGIQQLSSLQEADGSFPSFLSTNENDFTDLIPCQTTFISSIIFLSTIELPSTKNSIFMRKKLSAFLLSQKSEHWSWNYWKRGSQDAVSSPYPDDLDDTFCALAALAQYDKKMITGDIFAHIVKLLTFVEKNEGGPYRTWLVKKNSAAHWMDIDIAVNSNIAYFLSLYDITLPNLERYFESTIKRKNIISPYYPSFYSPVYFMSRFYKGRSKNIIKTMLWDQRKRNGSWENPLKTALAIVTLLNLRVHVSKLEKSVEYLISTQKDGLWSAYGFVINQVKNEQHFFLGSSALTTALCLEALQKYESAQQEIAEKKRKRAREALEKNYYYNEIVNYVLKYFHSYGNEIYNKAEVIIQRIQKNDTAQQIPLLPYFFFQSLNKKNTKISKNILMKLGAANIFGWIAYTIYDDFLDEEGDPSFLPLAIISLRQLTYIFDTFTLRKKRIQKLYHTLLNKVDLANTIELKNRSLTSNIYDIKEFDRLADKSIGHALGPLTILILLGYTQESGEFKNILLFFTHYLIAKQLNDDAHDWEEDLKRKHITPVVALLLKRAEEKKITKSRKHLQELFWMEIIQEVCKLIHTHARKAKIALNKSSLIADKTILENILEIPVMAADKALEEKRNVTAFLRSYQT
jgi:hypothetical protein